MLRAPPRCAAALLTSLALTSAAALSRAQERIDLRWAAPDGCPGAGAVKSEVDRLLGASRARPSRPIDVSAQVSRDDRGTWHVRLETPGDGAPRVREIHGASCAAIADATALILALMIDPDAVAQSPASPPAPPPSTSPRAAVDPAPPSTAQAPSPSAPVPAPPPTAPAPLPTAAPPFPVASAPPARPAAPRPAAPKGPPGPDVSFRLGAWMGADAGSLPGVSFGFGATASLLIGAQRIELGIAARPGSDASLPGRPTAGGSVDLIAGWAGTCRSLLRRPVSLGPCVALEVGRLHAAGFGVSEPGEGERPWAAASAGGLLVWSPLGRLGFALRVDLVVPLTRPTFVIEDLGPVHRPGDVAGRASIGLEYAF
jgi:hypothetical protein